MNSVNIIGRVGRDPELRYTPSNMAVLDLGLALTDRVKRGEKWEDETSWIEVTFFGKTAETVSKYVAKGDNLGVSGRLKQDEWTDKESGAKRSKVKVICERVKLLGTKGGQQKPANDYDQSGKTTDEYSQSPEPNHGDPADIPF